jgi:hypothetical protein
MSITRTFDLFIDRTRAIRGEWCYTNGWDLNLSFSKLYVTKRVNENAGLIFHHTRMSVVLIIRLPRPTTALPRGFGSLAPRNDISDRFFLRACFRF